MPESQSLELELYMGLCSSHGCPETRFNDSSSQSDNPFLQRLYRDAKQTAAKIIQRELNSPLEYAIRIGWGMRCMHFVKSDAEAKKIIDYAEKNIPGAQAIIEPIDCMHGQIRFFRKIRFIGANFEQLEEIVEKLKQSGYDVPDEFWRTAFGFGSMRYYDKNDS